MSERNVSPPIYGVETEYSCLINFPGDVVYETVGSCHSVDAQIGLYAQPEYTGGRKIPHEKIESALKNMDIASNQLGMLSNGGRLYIDPSGLEYATPETTSAEEAVHRVFDGDKILIGLLGYFASEGIIESFQINRRVVDHNRTSRGVHINTLTKLKNVSPAYKVTMWLATLNVAKGTLFGSGGLLLDENGKTEYHHSPRLSITDRAQANFQVYTLRPLVRTPFKEDGRKLGRIETVSSDAINLGWPLKASMVVTNAIVGLIEMGYGSKLPVIDEDKAVQSAHNVGRNGHEAHMVLKSKRQQEVIVRALDVLKKMIEIALEVDEKEKYLDEESQQVLPEILEVADKIDADPYSVANQVESMARLLAMERKMKTSNQSIDSERLCRFDYAWDWVGGGGIAETLRARGNVGWQGFSNVPLLSKQKERITTPPQDTRAFVRSKIIKQENVYDQSTWEYIYKPDGYNRAYLHPLATKNPLEQTEK